jgi:hypothetical protein
MAAKTQKRCNTAAKDRFAPFYESPNKGNTMSDNTGQNEFEVGRLYG